MSSWGFRENGGRGRASDMIAQVVFCSTTQEAMRFDCRTPGVSGVCRDDLHHGRQWPLSGRGGEGAKWG